MSTPEYFPCPSQASAEGLLCFGGQLTPAWLLDAYRHGIFPWPVLADDEPLAWWSPDPRAIIEFSAFRTSRRLLRTLRGGKFTITRNQRFADVIDGCATTPGRRESTWLTPGMITAYVELHRLGYAHSVEVWHAVTLAGGVYGVGRHVRGGIEILSSSRRLQGCPSSARRAFSEPRLRVVGHSADDRTFATIWCQRDPSTRIP